MDYKQHKGNLRGQIKNQVERKLYNKRIRAEAINTDTSERQLTIPDVINQERSCETRIWYASAKKCKTCDEDWSEFERSC
jgi:hypothetical protein